MPSTAEKFEVVKKLQKSIVLGIDPGFVTTGYGIIENKGYSNIEYIDCGIINTSSHVTLEEKLSYMYGGVTNILTEYQPDSVAMEEVFVNVNPRTSKLLIMGRTAAFLACSNLGYNVFEYTANTIKKNITGNGHASKDTIHMMVQKLTNKTISKERDKITSDSVDALAIAICHAFSNNF